MMPKLAICLHPVHLICAPGGLAIKAQTVLHPRFIIAARKRKSRTSIPFFQEVIKRDEVDSLPPIRRKKEEPARAPTRTSQKGDESRRPSPQKYHNVRQTARM
jgi:hypothetical protein